VLEVKVQPDHLFAAGQASKSGYILQLVNDVYDIMLGVVRNDIADCYMNFLYWLGL
jgi:hypothetical protein